MHQLLSDNYVAIGGSALGAILLFVMRVVWKAVGKEKLLRLGVELAHGVVAEASKHTATTVDDQIAKGLAALRDYLADHGEELKPDDEARVKAELLSKALAQGAKQ